MTWDLAPGTRLPRADVHARFGGRPKPRISPSKSSPNVLLFAAPATAAGRFDGWSGEHVHFGGEGGTDGTDQVLTHGNGTVLRHEAEQRALRLFRPGDDGTVEYVGEYRLARKRPVAHAEAPADPRQPLQVRRTVVFRLTPLDGPPHTLPPVEATAARLRLRRTEPGIPTGTAPTPGHEAAAKLLRDYELHARHIHQCDVTGYRITPADSLTSWHVELLDHTRNEVLATLTTLARPAVWEALGRLHDQARHFRPRPRRVLLMPTGPDAGLAALLRAQKVTALWPSGPEDFTRTP
ncbi:hypothetical protein [Kitasatospora sp. NPDC088783]|uniref:hypothetical protein n=1 Tax=Kitasatospora sp. NPDC088783 TaxID=3364077 RepID=UPI0037F2DEC9